MAIIETDVPPPSHAGRWPKRDDFPTPSRQEILSMQPGNSIFFKGGELERGRVATALNKLKATKHHDRVFTMRKADGGYRFWRLK